RLAAKASLPRMERWALGAVVEELRELDQDSAPCLLPLLLGSYLSAAEPLYRREDPRRAGMYGLGPPGLQPLTPGPRAARPGCWKPGPLAEGADPPPQNCVHRLLACGLGRLARVCGFQADVPGRSGLPGRTSNESASARRTYPLHPAENR